MTISWRVWQSQGLFGWFVQGAADAAELQGQTSMLIIL